MSEVAVVALEHGADWHAGSCTRSASDLVVVVQQEGEPAMTFAQRFIRRMGNAVNEGARVVSAVLAVAPRLDIKTLEARCAIARAALGQLHAGKDTQLLFTAAKGATPDCRAHLRALATALGEIAGRDTSISIRVDQRAEEATLARWLPSSTS